MQEKKLHREEQTMASEEKKIYTIEDIVPEEIYEDSVGSFS